MQRPGPCSLDGFVPGIALDVFSLSVHTGVRMSACVIEVMLLSRSSVCSVERMKRNAETFDVITIAVTSPLQAARQVDGFF